MYCKYCGHELNSENICTNPECPSKTNINNDSYNNSEQQGATFNEFRDFNGISTSEMVNFVGEKKADYYLEKWHRYLENENFISWNWPAFLGGFYWFWYRKMYSIMLIVLSISVSGTLFLPEVALNILSLGLTIGFGLFGNQLYMKHTTKKILSIKSAESRGVDYNTITRRLRVNGGTTIAAIIAFIVLFIFVFLITLAYEFIHAGSSLY